MVVVLLSPSRSKPRIQLAPVQRKRFTLFTVIAGSVDEYFGFDPDRETELRALDALIRAAAPSLARWFVPGTAAGEPGMTMTMIGYGQFEYTVKSSAARRARRVC